MTVRDDKGKGRNSVIALSTVLLVSFALITVNIKSSKRPMFFESLVFNIISPFQNALAHTLQAITEWSDHYIFLRNVAIENESLRAEVESLTWQKNKLKESLLQGQRLSQLLETPEGLGSNHNVATVIGRDATQWSKVIFIDKGTEDGISENMTIASNLGVIGHVIQVGSGISKVLLINDSRSAVDALFQNSRIFGVVTGTGGEDCKMKYVPLEANVKVGDKVVSSGLGGAFPKGWMVGTVVNVVKKKQGLFQEITVKPSADLNRLEEVLVLLP